MFSHWVSHLFCRFLLGAPPQGREPELDGPLPGARAPSRGRGAGQVCSPHLQVPGATSPASPVLPSLGKKQESRRTGSTRRGATEASPLLPDLPALAEVREPSMNCRELSAAEAARGGDLPAATPCFENAGPAQPRTWGACRPSEMGMAGQNPLRLLPQGPQCAQTPPTGPQYWGRSPGPSNISSPLKVLFG